MAEFQNLTPLSGQPPVITGGPGLPGQKRGWLHRLREFLWPSVGGASRKIIVVAVLFGVILLIALLWLLLILNAPKPTPPTPPPSATSEENEQTGPNNTNPDTQTPDPGQQTQPPTNPQQGGNGSQGSGTGGGGSTNDDSDDGSTGGGSDDDGGGGSSTCPLPAYPKESCTGVPAGTSLTAYSGDFSTTSNNQIISGLRITGDLAVNHDNVIIRNSEIYGHIKNFSGGGHFTVEDSTVGPPSGCVTDAAFGNYNYTANRVHLRGFAEGFRVEGGSDVIVRNSFIKFCNPNEDTHADAIQGYLAGDNVIFEHNTVDMRDVPIAADYVTAVIFWSDSSGNNVTFKDNLISGGSYSIRIHVGSGHTVSGNKVINNSWLYGPVSSNCSAIAWSNNSIVEIDGDYNITNTVSQLDCAE